MPRANEAVFPVIRYGRPSHALGCRLPFAWPVLALCSRAMFCSRSMAALRSEAIERGMILSMMYVSIRLGSAVIGSSRKRERTLVTTAPLALTSFQATCSTRERGTDMGTEGVWAEDAGAAALGTSPAEE